MIQYQDSRAQMERNRRYHAALKTVKDPTLVQLRITGPASRAMIRELNDSIGMSGYEILGYRPLNAEEVEGEIMVPREIALMIKLKWGAQ